MKLCKPFFGFWLVFIVFVPAYAMQKGAKEAPANPKAAHVSPTSASASASAEAVPVEEEPQRPEPVQPEPIKSQDMGRIAKLMGAARSALAPDPCARKVCQPMVQYCTVKAKDKVHPLLSNAVSIKNWLHQAMEDPGCNLNQILIGRVLSDFLGNRNKFFNDAAIDHFMGQVRGHSAGMIRELKENFGVARLLDAHKDLWNDLGEEIGSEALFQKISSKDRDHMKSFRSALVSETKNGVFLTEDEKNMKSSTAAFYHLLKRFEIMSDWKILSHSIPDSKGVIGRGANNDFINFFYDNFKKDVTANKRLAGPLFQEEVADHLRLRKIMDLMMHASNFYGTAIRLENKCEQVIAGEGAASQIASELLTYLENLQANYFPTDELFPDCKNKQIEGERQKIASALNNQAQILRNIISACPDI